MTDSPLRGVRVAMLLTNPYRPDVRVQKEAFALAAAGAQVVVFAWDRSGRLPTIEQPYEGVTIRRLLIRSRDGLGIRQFPRFLRYWRAAARAVGAERWDVLHAHDLDGLVGAVLSNRGDARLVYDAHELFALIVGHRLGAVAERASWALERCLVRQVDLVITDGHARARALRRIFRIPAAVAVENTAAAAIGSAPAESRASLRRAHGIPADAWVIGVFASLTKAKVLEPLWVALDRLPDSWVVVAGDGPEASAVAAVATRHPRVLYLGYVQDLAPWYRAIDVVYYALSSRTRNSRLGFPNNVAAAAVARVPLLVADVGECGRLVRRHRLGYVMPEATVEDVVNGMANLRRPEMYAAYVAAARAASPRFTWEQSAQTLVEAYQRLVGRQA